MLRRGAMRTCYLLACFCMALSASQAHAQQTSVGVAAQGETIVSASAGKLTVEVRIKTHEVQIGKPSDPRSTVVQSNCTYSRYPCSLVDQLGIVVNGTPLFVPRSAFCDLADVNQAEISFGAEGAFLRLDGGDGAESFIVKIEFDKTRVKRRSVAAGEAPEELLEETNYHVVVFD